MNTICFGGGYEFSLKLLVVSGATFI